MIYRVPQSIQDQELEECNKESGGSPRRTVDQNRPYAAYQVLDALQDGGILRDLGVTQAGIE